MSNLFENLRGLTSCAWKIQLPAQLTGLEQLALVFIPVALSEFLAQNKDVRGCLDPYADFAAIDVHHRENDFASVPDNYPFAHLPTQNQHGEPPCCWPPIPSAAHPT
jgi:hypothetical protein